jgi:hypothetical protein
LATIQSRRCIIHIGAPKTGTTLLQKLFFDNRLRLLERGILYPDVSLRGYGHHDLAFLLAGGYPEWATPQPRPLIELTAELRASAQAHTGDLLISSENFFLFPAPHALRRLLDETGALEGRRPLIVVYLRRQDAAHESWYNQSIKAQGETHQFDACVERYHELWDYRLQLDAWIAVFGRESIVVRPYEDGQFLNGSLIDDFLATIGVDGSAFAIPAERINSGINKDVLEFQRIVNGLPVTIEEKRKFHRQLIELTTHTAGTGLFDESAEIDGAKRRAILAGYASGNASVAREFLDRDGLFAEEPEDVPVANSPGLTLEKLTAIIGWLMLRTGA